MGLFRSSPADGRRLLASFPSARSFTDSGLALRLDIFSSSSGEVRGGGNVDGWPLAALGSFSPDFPVSSLHSHSRSEPPPTLNSRPSYRTLFTLQEPRTEPLSPTVLLH